MRSSREERIFPQLTDSTQTPWARFTGRGACSSTRNVFLGQVTGGEEFPSCEEALDCTGTRANVPFSPHPLCLVLAKGRELFSKQQICPQVHFALAYRGRVSCETSTWDLSISFMSGIQLSLLWQQILTTFHASFYCRKLPFTKLSAIFLFNGLIALHAIQ